MKTEVFLLPAANFAEKDGSFVNSARWIQWKWKAVDPPGDAKPDQEIVGRIFLKVRELYEREGGTFPEPIRNLNWWYSNPASPSLDEVCKELNGWAVEDVRDATGAVTMRAGQQLGAVRRRAGRWFDALRQLALHRDVHGRRQPHAAPLVRRSKRPRAIP